MSKTPVQLQPLDQAVGAQLSAISVLPKITCPYTSIINRAQCTDFSQDLLPRFGVERFMTQQIVEVQGESGPNGERVFKAVNDVHDAVRFVGGWLNSVGAQGPNIYAGVSGSYVEITFYGTGLNLLVFQDASNRDFSVSVDGGGSSTIANTGSDVIQLRNYSANAVLSAASNLSLGTHTVKITTLSTVNRIWFGYEVLNTSSTLQHVPGTSFAGGSRLYATGLTTSLPTSGFTNTYGAPGTKGGHVLVYQKPDGTIAKDIRYTESGTPLYLSAANHTNEEVIRTHHWREFGAGRASPADDFSSLATTNSSRAFTLDDGTTTLVGSSVAGASGVLTEAACLNAVGAFVTITFVGTGLDIVRADNATTGSTDTLALSVDGGSNGNLLNTGSTNTRIEKICSGLPYGTHTVKITATTNTNFTMGVRQFIVYGPKTPTLPAGCVALADYFVMADYAVSPSAVAETVPSGALRKVSNREAVYSGTWVTPAVNAAFFSSGFNLRTVTSGSYVEYTFFGTGVEYRGAFNSGDTYSLAITMDGSSNLSGFTTGVVTSSTGYTFTAASGTLTGTVTGSNLFVLRLSGLSLGVHKIRITSNSAANLYVDTFDVVTPIHAPKNNGPFVVQNTLSVGSCSIRDLRTFGEGQVPEQKVVAQAVGIGTSATTNLLTFIPAADMSCTVKTSGNPVQISYSATCVSGGVGQNVFTQIFVNGSPVGVDIVGFSIGAVLGPLSQTMVLPLPAGVHKIDLYWRVDGGTSSLNATRRILSVREL